MTQHLADTGFLNVRGQRLEYCWIAPQSDALQHPVLVLLHEGLGCVTMWKDFPAQLAARTGCGVFIYSRAGYGRSDPALLPRPARYMHDEAELILPALLAAAGIEQPVLLGHSDGGSIALIYAGSHPDAVRGLVLLAPHVFNEPLCIEAITAAGERYRNSDLPQRLAKYHGTQADAAFWGWHDVWLSPAFRQWNIEASLASITAPTLLIQSTQDPYGTLAQIDAISGQLSGPVEQRLLTNCAHAPHLEQPVQTLTAIQEFLYKLL